MSADNGIYILHFPSGKIAVIGGSDSFVHELANEPWQFETPKQYHRALCEFLSFAAWSESEKEAREYADGMAAQGHTEYGVCSIDMPFDPDTPPESLPEKPPLPDYACRHCSTDHTLVSHGPQDWDGTNCKDPNLPYNIISNAVRARLPGVQEVRVARVVLDALRDADKQIVSRGEAPEGAILDELPGVDVSTEEVEEFLREIGKSS